MTLLEVVSGDGSSADGEREEVGDCSEEFVRGDGTWWTSVGFGDFVEGEVEEGWTDAFEETVEVRERAVLVVEGEGVEEDDGGEIGERDGGEDDEGGDVVEWICSAEVDDEGAVERARVRGKNKTRWLVSVQSLDVFYCLRLKSARRDS